MKGSYASSTFLFFVILITHLSFPSSLMAAGIKGAVYKPTPCFPESGFCIQILAPYTGKLIVFRKQSGGRLLLIKKLNTGKDGSFATKLSAGLYNIDIPKNSFSSRNVGIRNGKNIRVETRATTELELMLGFQKF